MFVVAVIVVVVGNVDVIWWVIYYKMFLFLNNEPYMVRPMLTDLSSN